MTRLMTKPRVTMLVMLVLVLFMGYEFFQWTVCRIYVPVGYSLMLRYKGPLIFGSRKAAQPGHFAQVDDRGRTTEIGILEQMLGPGRHFYCPIWWERELVPDVTVKPGEIGVITSKLGDNLPGDRFLVEGDLDHITNRGLLRKTFGPGRYRVNPFGFEFNKIKTQTTRNGQQLKLAGWVEVPTGFVGVVTNLTDVPADEVNPKAQKSGIQQQVLQPGIYLVNPRERQVDIVEIGYREKSFSVHKKLDAEGKTLFDESGEPSVDELAGGLRFPSNDGFRIFMDFTAIWGLLPSQAAEAVKTFGSVHAVEDRVVAPQIESICRNRGSQLGAVELLVGESRSRFQDETAQAFEETLKQANVSLLYGVVRYIAIPQEVRIPIQEANLAGELKLTREQEQLTARTEAKLREAERRVILESKRILVETDKLVAEAIAEGHKTAEETRATTIKLAAAITRQTAELEAEAQVKLGEASASSEQLMQEARAQKFGLAVKAFGSAEAYNQWFFANQLPSNIELNMLYAGQGTFWTDLSTFTDVMLARQLMQAPAANTPAATTAPAASDAPAGANAKAVSAPSAPASAPTPKPRTRPRQ